jgi:hypothetical protein
MAFTKEEIEEALNSPSVGIPGLQPDIEIPGYNTIYQPVMDYLVGKITSLSNLQLDYNAYGCVRLLNLLKNIEHPSANDHLILQVVHHPDLAHLIKYFYSQWLFQYALTHSGKTALQAVISQFRLNGMNDDEIFSFFISNIDCETEDDSGLEGTVVKEYLTERIRKEKILTYPAGGRFGWENDWSMFYFKLLEEVRPESAADYVLFGICSDRNCPVAYFTTYREGYYIPFFLKSLQNNHNPDLRTLHSRFTLALRLYEAVEAKYDLIASQVSQQYLEYLTTHNLQEPEDRIHWKQPDQTFLNYVPCSSGAFNVLFKQNRSNAEEILKVFFSKKLYLPYETIQVIQLHMGEDAFSYIEMAIQADSGRADYCRSLIGLLQKEFEKTKYLPLVWSQVGNKSRPLRELVAKIVVEEDPDAEAKAIELLRNKKAETRQTAALVLSQFSSISANQAIAKVLNTEINDNARDILLHTAVGSFPAHPGGTFIDEMISAAKGRSKLNEPVEAWLDEMLLPPLYDLDGKQMSNDHVRFLLYRMSRVKDMRSDIEAKYVIPLIDKEKASSFALELIKIFIDKGGKPAYKYLMVLAAMLGNDDVADKIRLTINRWIDEDRYKMAEYGVSALALQGSDKALRWVEWYSRKYKNKKVSVGAAAIAALETAAEELGITTQELGDRVVPDFGFDGLFKHFIINGDEYRAFIDSNFKIAFFNENNQKLKSLPATASTELKEEFKAIGKEVREIVRSQSSRLEYYLIVQRKWSYEQWQKFFLQNPVMFIYATRLLWGIYTHEGKLLQAFRCSEDTSLIDINNDEIDIKPSNIIGIIHPSQLNKESLQQWKKQFFDLSIESMFPQLDRRMPEMNGIELTKSIITKFDGKTMVTGSIRSTLERCGWRKGATGDGGMLASFHLLFAEVEIEAVLEVDGVGAGYNWGGDEKTGRLYIIDKSKIKHLWFIQPQNDNDDRLVKLEKVPIIFLNEMLASVELIKVKEK